MFLKSSILLSLVAICSASLANKDPNTLDCDPEGLGHLMLPHFVDCKKFYMCTHGNEVEFTCPDGTLFDFANQVCNHEAITECQLRDPKADDDIGEASGWGAEDETIEQGVHDSPLNCARPSLSTRTAVYRGDCSRYWYCLDGIAETAFCSDGLYYNPHKAQCDYEANVKCAYDIHHSELGSEFIVA